MSKKHTTLNASIIDTRRPTVAGADRHPGWHALRKIAARITTPLLPDDYLHLANPLWSARELRGRILGVRRDGRLRDPVHQTGLGLQFRLPAGPIHRDRAAGRRALALAVVFADVESGGIRVRAHGDRHGEGDARGLPVHPLGGRGKARDHCAAGCAQGNFVLPDPAPPLILFLTAGSGITPVMSMLRTLVRRNQITDVVHLHSAPTAADVMFGAELAALAADHPGYRLSVRETRAQGRLDLTRIGQQVPDWRERQTWACGPEGVLNQADKVWSSAGASDRLHLERFAVSKTAPAGAGGTVTFARSGKSVAADAATSLMDAGEGAGVQLPFGCRMGICQSCVVDLVEGHVRDLRTGQRHEPGTRVQTCVSAASGDCVLDI